MFYSLVTLLAATQALAAPSSPEAAPLKSRLAAPAAFITTSDLSHKLSPATAPISGRGNAGGSSTWDLKVDDTAAGHKQTIIGFGGSVTDATVTVLNALSADKRSQLLRELLTTDSNNGADFSFLRHTIASSDLSGPPAYTYDDAGGKADPGLDSFNLGDRGTAMAKMLASMRGIKAGLTILGSPWSAPGWMKLNRVSVSLSLYLFSPFLLQFVLVLLKGNEFTKNFRGYTSKHMKKITRMISSILIFYLPNLVGPHRQREQQPARLAILLAIRAVLREIPAILQEPRRHHRRHHAAERAPEQPRRRPRDDVPVCGRGGTRNTTICWSRAAERGVRYADLGVRSQHRSAGLPAHRDQWGWRVRG